MNRKIEAYKFIILIGILVIIIGCIALRLSLVYAFSTAIPFSLGMLLIMKHKIRELLVLIYNGLKGCSIIFIIIMLMGMNIAVWMSSGVVPSLIFYGFKYVQNINFVVAAFLITSIISFVMGTALGTVSTIGIAILAIGHGMDIPLPVLLGAVLSGSFIADRASPVSGLVNLTLTATELKYNAYIKEIIKTLVPAFLITTAVYYFLGRGYAINPSFETIELYRSGIADYFKISPLLIMLPVTIVFLAIIGIKTKINMAISVLVGAGVSVFYQGYSINEIANILLYGFSSSSGIEKLDSILRGGGLLPMVEVLLIVAGAVSLSSILEGTGIIDKLILGVTEKMNSRAKLIAGTGAISSGLTIVTCDQTVGIILLGKILRKDFKSKGMNNLQLARIISDTGTTIAPLIPWNVNSLIIVAITGVSTIYYAPYTVLCYVSPIAAILLGLIAKNKEA